MSDLDEPHIPGFEPTERKLMPIEDRNALIDQWLSSLASCPLASNWNVLRDAADRLKKLLTTAEYGQ